MTIKMLYTVSICCYC